MFSKTFLENGNLKFFKIKWINKFNIIIVVIIWVTYFGQATDMSHQLKSPSDAHNPKSNKPSLLSL